MSNSNSQVGVLAVLGVIVAGVIGLALWRHNHAATTGRLPTPTFAAEEASEPVDINVYVDGSGSIKNFLPPAPKADAKAVDKSSADKPNYFESFLNKCNVALNQAQPNGEPRYWMFGGGDPVELKNDDRMRKIGVTNLHDLSIHPEAFKEPTTDIETAVRYEPKPQKSDAPPKSLKIIVTDLYQSGGDQGPPANALANVYLKSSSDPAISGADAIGVLAVRNPFYGPVEDLPGLAKDGSLPGAADSMPFYVIVAGPVGAVRKSMDLLIKETGLRDAFAKNKAVAFFFSRRLGGKLDIPARHLQGKHFTETKNFNNTSYSLVEVPHGVPLSVVWQRVDLPTMESAGSKAAFIDVAPPDTILVSAKTMDSKGQVVDDAKAAAAFSGCDPQSLVCKLHGPMPGNKTYLFEFDLLSRTSDALQPKQGCKPDATSMGGQAVGSQHSSRPCLDDWNIELDDALNVSRKTKVFQPDPRIADSEHPGKTPDLSKFLTALQGEMFEDKVKLATDYLYIQAK